MCKESDRIDADTVDANSELQRYTAELQAELHFRHRVPNSSGLSRSAVIYYKIVHVVWWNSHHKKLYILLHYRSNPNLKLYGNQ